MDKISDLRSSVNETARVARTNLLFFLIVGLYIGILVASTDDLLLLKQQNINLPFMQIGVPVGMFYGAAPVLFLILHLNLVHRLNRVAHITVLMRDQFHELEFRQRRFQSALIFPFDFVQLLLYNSSRGTGQLHSHRPLNFSNFLKYYISHSRSKLLLLVIVAIPVSLFPLFLLLWIQMRFLAYQSSSITFTHQMVLTLDLLMQILFFVQFGSIPRMVQTLKFGSWSQRSWAGTSVLITALATFLFLVFVWCIAVVPDSWIEQRRPFQKTLSSISAKVFDDWWEREDCSRNRQTLMIRNDNPRYFRRYLYLKGKTIAKEPRPSEIISAYIREGGTPDSAWRFVDELNLSNRSIRYGWFESAQIWRTTLSYADLYCANLMRAKLRGTNLLGAKLRSVDLRRADLRDADLEIARLDDANLAHAKLHQANLRSATLNRANLQGAKLHGANLRSATLYEAELNFAELYGTNLVFSQLHGANLQGAKLHGANLAKAELYGADLSGAELHGAELTDALFGGANLSRAELYGANLRKTDLLGADLYMAKLHGADFSSAIFNLTDIRETELQEPPNWSKIKDNIVFGLNERGLSEARINRSIAQIDRRAKRDYHWRGPDAHEDIECVWSSGSGPFTGWPLPAENCQRKLETLYVDTICEPEEKVIARGMIERLRSLDTILNANNALALLETDLTMCSTLTIELRRELCKALDVWSDEQGYEIGRHRVIDSVLDASDNTFERWSRQLTVGICIQALSEPKE